MLLSCTKASKLARNAEQRQKTNKPSDARAHECFVFKRVLEKKVRNFLASAKGSSEKIRFFSFLDIVIVQKCIEIRSGTLHNTKKQTYRQTHQLMNILFLLESSEKKVRKSLASAEGASEKIEVF